MNSVTSRLPQPPLSLSRFSSYTEFQNFHLLYILLLVTDEMLRYAAAEYRSRAVSLKNSTTICWLRCFRSCLCSLCILRNNTQSLFAHSCHF